MDSSIRPIQNQPTRPPAPIARRREGDAAFHVPDEEPDDEPEGDAAPNEHAEDRPVAPRPDDEAGSHLDITG